MRMRLTTLAIGLSLLAAACGGGTGGGGTSGGSGGQASAAPKADIKVGLAISLTGAANTFGPAQQRGAELAVEEINRGGGIDGAKLQLVIQDDASTRDQGITVFRKFINEDKVAAIIGPTLSGTAAGAHPVAQAAGVPTVAISNTGIGIVGKCDYGPCDWIFRASLGEETAVPETVKAAKAKLGLKKVVIIYASDGKFESDDLVIFKKALAAEGVAVAKEIAYTSKDVDFAPFVTQAKNENPDAIIASSLAVPAGKILLEVQKQMPGVRVIGGNGLNSAALLTNAAASLMIVGTAWSKGSTEKANTDFIAAYKAKHNADPDQFAAQAYTGVKVLADAMKRSGDPNDKAKLKKALEGVKDLQTPLGPFSFTAEHDVKQPVFVMTVKDGQFTPFQ